MKKTLIALMALAGVAMGETPITFNTGEFNWSLDYTLDQLGYTEGDAFTLNFTVATFNHASGHMMTLGEHYFMTTQASNSACHVGLSYINSAVYTSATEQASPSFVPPTTSVAGSGSITWESDGPLYSWITSDPGATVTYQKYIDGANVTISSDGSSSYISLAIKDNGPVSHVYLNNVALNANDLALGSLVTSASGTLSVGNGAATNIIPEPATATLSLLALAGLAARRRRK